LQGASTLRMDPLRQSLQGLAGHGGDPGGSRGAAATSGPLAAPPQAGLLGPWSQQQQRGQAEAQWQQERQRESYEGEGAAMNMASPVLPLQHGSRAGSPLHAHGGGGGIGEGPLVAAKRNLMHVLQSREARPAWKPAGVTVRQPLPPPRQARAASERAQPPAPVARATHVTLAQLLSGGSGARAGSGQHAGRQPSAGAKRGRESAAGSTATSGAPQQRLSLIQRTLCCLLDWHRLHSQRQAMSSCYFARPLQSRPPTCPLSLPACAVQRMGPPSPPSAATSASPPTAARPSTCCCRRPGAAPPSGPTWRPAAAAATSAAP
jgi:hypothetical protein